MTTPLHANHVRNRFLLRDRLVAAVDRGTALSAAQIADLISDSSMHVLAAIALSIGEQPCSRETWDEVATVFRSRASTVTAWDGTSMGEWSDGKAGRQ